jgi:hypothetical protein
MAGWLLILPAFSSASQFWIRLYIDTTESNFVHTRLPVFVYLSSRSVVLATLVVLYDSLEGKETCYIWPNDLKSLWKSSRDSKTILE